jgi:hypothetical protein
MSRSKNAFLAAVERGEMVSPIGDLLAIPASNPDELVLTFPTAPDLGTFRVTVREALGFARKVGANAVAMRDDDTLAFTYDAATDSAELYDPRGENVLAVSTWGALASRKVA